MKSLKWLLNEKKIREVQLKPSAFNYAKPSSVDEVLGLGVTRDVVEQVVGEISYLVDAPSTALGDGSGLFTAILSSSLGSNGCGQGNSHNTIPVSGNSNAKVDGS